jgi:hypothetical protein
MTIMASFVQRDAVVVVVVVVVDGEIASLIHDPFSPTARCVREGKCRMALAMLGTRGLGGTCRRGRFLACCLVYQNY